MTFLSVLALEIRRGFARRACRRYGHLELRSHTPATCGRCWKVLS